MEMQSTPSRVPNGNTERRGRLEDLERRGVTKYVSYGIIVIYENLREDLHSICMNSRWKRIERRRRVPLCMRYLCIRF